MVHGFQPCLMTPEGIPMAISLEYNGIYYDKTIRDGIFGVPDLHVVCTIWMDIYIYIYIHMKDHEGTFYQQTIWHTQQPVCWKATGVSKLAGLATMNFTLIPGAVSSQMVWIPKSMTFFQ